MAEQPIQYYVDRGAPEPIRKALVEGAGWWDEAFQSAGWAPGTFKVDVMPEGADPMDVRYNVIQWVHRYTRGWSYGAPIADPRTGEIIKGNVTLGSLRGRQDYLIAEALLSPYVAGRKFTPQDDPMQAMVLARLRQLAAHETGHTLGLAHNFAASAFPHSPSQSVSVMDYPHPWITLDGSGAPDLSQAYAVGIGQWDRVAIDYGYRQFMDQSDETAALGKILMDSEKIGLMFISDDDARPLGGAHPHAHLWDNGGDPADELERILTIRSAALSRFGDHAIRPGAPMAQLEDTLVPLYLLHRYQTEAAIKEIGGLDYRYQLRGDGQMSPAIVSPSDQRKALKAVLKTLAPEFLTLPERLLKMFPPRPPAFERTRESLPSDSGLTFDPVAAAECAADLTLAGLFQRAVARGTPGGIPCAQSAKSLAARGGDRRDLRRDPAGAVGKGRKSRDSFRRRATRGVRASGRGIAVLGGEPAGVLRGAGHCLCEAGSDQTANTRKLIDRRIPEASHRAVSEGAGEIYARAAGRGAARHADWRRGGMKMACAAQR